MFVAPGEAPSAPSDPHEVEFLVWDGRSVDASLAGLELQAKVDTGVHSHHEIEEFFHGFSGEAVVKIRVRSVSGAWVRRPGSGGGPHPDGHDAARTRTLPRGIP